ncbi:hypothetical protein BT69DRAFT_1266317 [Atractiella rhizophila]|nr:hypothetical protein BT69DRAFT_1266317 [Atractiella rhizophila]
MAFHPCSLLAVFFIISSIILTIFSQIAQTSVESIPTKLRLVMLDVSHFGVGLGAALGQEGNLTALYARDGTVPTGNAIGIGSRYEWGLWSHCTYINASLPLSDRAECSSTSFGATFKPYPILLSDVPPQYTESVAAVIPKSTFTSTGYLERLSQAAFYFLFIGALFSGIALIFGFGAHRYAYLLAAGFAFAAGALQAVGAIIWTVIVAKIKNDINDLVVGSPVQTPLGIKFSYGSALWIIWGSVAALLFSIVPFFFACCTGRNRNYY